MQPLYMYDLTAHQYIFQRCKGCNQSEKACVLFSGQCGLYSSEVVLPSARDRQQFGRTESIAACTLMQQSAHRNAQSAPPSVA